MQTIEGHSGEPIHKSAERAIKAANDTGDELFLVHNGIRLRVYPGSHEYDISDKYFLSLALERSKG